MLRAPCASRLRTPSSLASEEAASFTGRVPSAYQYLCPAPPTAARVTLIQFRRSSAGTQVLKALADAKGLGGTGRAQSFIRAKFEPSARKYFFGTH